MNTKTHQIGNKKIVEIISDEVLIKTPQDTIFLLEKFTEEYLVLYEHNFCKDFFDLNTRLAGEVLLKFTNYYIKLAIIGNFDLYPSKAFKALRYESNKQGEILFMKSIEDVLERWK